MTLEIHTIAIMTGGDSVLVSETLSRQVKMTISGKFPEPYPGYRCPLCLDHEDAVFTWSAILKAPICEGCDYELWDAVVCEKERPLDSLVLDRLEQISPLSFDEYRLIELEETIRIMAKKPDVDRTELDQYQADAERLRQVLKLRGA